MASGVMCRFDVSYNDLLTLHFGSPLKRYRRYLFGFILLQSLGILAIAQSPVPVAYMAYASVNGKLYVQGGATDTANSGTSQLYSLDLSQNWSTSSPPWKGLSIGTSAQPAPIDVFHSMTVSKDNGSLIVWGLYTGVSIYNISADSWTVESRAPIQVTAYSANLRAITDPNTGLVYVPSGSNNNTAMAVYNPDTNVTQSLPTPEASTGGTLFSYGATWSTWRGSILMYGGDSQNNTGSPRLVEYVPGASTWTALTPSGTSPGDLSRQCMIPAYNGTQIIFFGGLLRNETKSGSVYILDVPNLTWRKGSDIDPIHKQTGMACAVSGDNLIAWGGYLADNTRQSTPVIYNIKDDKWVSSTTGSSTPNNPGSSSGSNTPGSSSGPNTPGSGSKSPDTSSKGSSNGAIIGGVVAAVAVVVVAIGLFFYKRRKNAGQGRKEHDQHPSVTKEGTNGQDNIPFTDSTLPEILSTPGHVMAMSQLEYPKQQPIQPIQPMQHMQHIQPIQSVQAMQYIQPIRPPGTVQSMGAYENHGVQIANSPYEPSQHNVNPRNPQYYVNPGNSQYYVNPGNHQQYEISHVFPTNNIHAVYSSPRQYVTPLVYPTKNIYDVGNHHIPNNPHSIVPQPQFQAAQDPQVLPQQQFSSPVNSSQLPLEQQIAQVKQQQQQYLENLRQEQQEHLDMLEQQLIASNRNTNSE